MIRPSHFATILDYAFNLPARSLTVAALLALRRRPAACGIRHTAYGCGYAALGLSGEAVFHCTVTVH
ncbi:MAG: hypothetical protein ACR2L2_10015 [Acidobacteriota bacterium]